MSRLRNFRRVSKGIKVQFQADEKGFVGRECPKDGCEGYFKIVLGTGLEVEGLPCHCPYCGYSGSHNEFWTSEQIQYARSVAMREMSNALRKDLKRLEFDHKPKGQFGIGFSMKLKTGRPIPIRHYMERRLETDVICPECTLQYSVYGVFAFCPDCGQHNSLQILDKNLDVVERMLELGIGEDFELKEKLTENALEDCVSAFDGFGHELCRVHAIESSSPSEAKKMSFQNLEIAQSRVLSIFGVDIGNSLMPNDWQVAVNQFQKRHLIAHKLGVVDQRYLDRTQDNQAVVGRKIGINANEVQLLAKLLRNIAQFMTSEIGGSEEV